MRLEWKTFSVSKSGNRPDENEDACFPAPVNTGDTKDFRCALSDGATSTSFSGLWARMICEQAGSELLPGGENLRRVITKSQASWKSAVGSLDLPWHALEKSKQGAFATLLWFRAGQTGYSNRTLGTWQALAAGDTCFFHLREKRLQAAFPVQKSSEMKNNPFLFSSVEGRNDAVWKNNCIRKAQGAFEGGDEFLFMTDALAGWFLQEIEANSSPAGEILDILADPVIAERLFESFIRRLRIAGKIKNDDTTLGYLKIHREEMHLKEKGWN